VIFIPLFSFSSQPASVTRSERRFTRKTPKNHPEAVNSRLQITYALFGQFFFFFHIPDQMKVNAIFGENTE
jgi:hypothetical protein